MVKGRSIVIAAVLWSLFVWHVSPASLRAQGAAEQFKTGRALMDSNKAEAAIKAFEKAVALDDKNSEYHLWLGRAVGSVAQNASVLRQPFLARRVKSEFERAVQLDASNIGAREGLVSFYVQAPGVMGGSIPKAREQAEAIAKINPMRGHFARGSIAVHQKDFTTFEREIRAAADEDPDSVVAVTTLANYLSGNSHGDEAFVVIDKYLTRHPGDVLATFWIGRLAVITGKQLERGEKALRTVLATPNLGAEPNQPAPFTVHYRLGDIAAKSGNKDAARKEYERSLELNPKFEAAKKALKAL
jgi:tetratricopeptide (TPR) repeat protein